MKWVLLLTPINNKAQRGWVACSGITCESRLQAGFMSPQASQWAQPMQRAGSSQKDLLESWEFHAVIH